MNHSDMSLWDRVRWDVRRLYHQGRKVVLRRRIGDRWQDEGGFSQRRYPDYGTYVAHQRTKFSAYRSRSIIGHDRRFFDALTERIAAMPTDVKGRSVLCLAARQGTEVRAFIDRGAFAVGIDLNPGPGNTYVVVGDFHRLQYADGSVDLVYTNSLDHAYELDRILAEIHRVLRPGGILVLEVNVTADGGADRGPYESLVWHDAEVLLERLAEAGFRLNDSTEGSSFEVPWPGVQYVLNRAPRTAGRGFHDHQEKQRS